MTYIDEMMKELCPDGVEWKELGDLEVAKLSRGKVMSKQFLEENKGEFPVYSSQTANNGEIGKISSFDFDGEYITWTTDGANAGTVFYRQGKFSITNVCGLVDIQNDKLLTKFVYYYLTITTKKYVSSGMGNPKLMSNVMAKIKVPIPPLEIQQEIVQILDKFTEYVTELTAELTLRQKQYNYFRDYLLNFNNDSSGGANNKVYTVQWKTLGEVLVKGRGTKVTAGQMKELHKDGAPIRIFAGGKTFADVDYGDIPEKDIHHEEAVIVKSRGIIDFEYYTKPFSFKNEFWSYSSDNEDVNLRYVYHYLNHNKSYFQHIASNMQMPQISSNDTEKYKIPLPDKTVQSRIVQVLDNFDTVCNDLSIGLPKEIELRQKQYEFFRDKLLTFTAEGVYTDSTVQYSTVQYSTVQYRQDLIRLLTWVFGPIRVELGAVCDVVRGNGLQKKDFVGSGIPCIHYGQIYTYYGLATDETKSFVSPQLAQKLKKAGYGDVVVATTSENDEDLCKSVVWLGKEQCCISGDSLVLTHEQSGKYLAYAMRTDDFHKQKEKLITGTKVRRVSPANLSRIQLILPPLDQQKHIASILDRFDTLTTDLSQGLPAEIEQRQKQYEYWRDQLLQF
ncbi:restriction endonuclease subunit S [Streptococcus suis]|nr:restriction endonuclease subunit S [Streptococcus suis]